MIPADSYTLLQGKKGCGKSTIAATIAAAVTGGPSLPGLITLAPALVVWHGEEAQWEEVVVPRLHHAGASLPWVHRLSKQRASGQARRLVLPADFDELRAVLIGASVRLLILDPLSCIASPTIDLGHPQQGRDFGTLLSDLAFEASVTILATQHCKKGSGGDPLDAGYGSAELVNVARSVLRADRHPYRPDMHVLARVAGNARRIDASQLYRLVSATEDLPRIEWAGTDLVDAEAIAEGRGSEADRDEWADADALLASLIGKGWVVVKQLNLAAEAAGISQRMLRRAKARLKVPSRHRVVGSAQFWEWGPPRGGWPDGMIVADGEAGAVGDGGALPQRAPKKPRKTARKTPRRPRRSPAPTRPLEPPPETPAEENGNGSTADQFSGNSAADPTD